MGIEELHDLIDGDPTAKTYAEAGDDVLCAERCSEIAPTVPVETLRAYAGLSSTTLGVGPDATRRLIISVRAAAQADPLIDELQAKLRGNTGLDVSDEGVQDNLDALASAQIPNGLTADDAEAIKALGYARPTITFEQVSQAWSIHRVMFREEVAE